MKLRTGVMAAVAAMFVAFGSGCANTKQTAERDSLLNQNKELQDQLAAEKAATAAADARANAAASQASASTPSESTSPPSMGSGSDSSGGALDMSGGGTGSRTGCIGSGRSGGLPSSLGEGVGSSLNGAGEVVLEIQGDVLFDSGKAMIKPSAKKTLDSVASAIKKQYAGQMLRIEGHTDASPVKGSGWDDNWDLGAARARAVLLYLSGKGVSQRDMYIASFAANDPKSTKNPALNRRVDIVVVKNGSK